MTSSSLRPRVLELVTYVGASAIAFAADVGVLTLLVAKAGMAPVAAASISFIVGGALLYALSVAFVFRQRRYRNVSVEASCFVALGLVGFAINAGVMYLMVASFNVHFLLAKIAAAGCTFGANYLLRRTLLFTAARESTASPEAAQ